MEQDIYIPSHIMGQILSYTKAPLHWYMWELGAMGIPDLPHINIILTIPPALLGGQCRNSQFHMGIVLLNISSGREI